jgi:cytidylate kinase
MTGVTPTGPPRVVAISATYGAGGTRVGPLVAERLGLPFLPRLVAPDVASGAGGEGLESHEQPEGLLRRVVEALAKMPALIGTTMPMPAETLSDERRLRMMIEDETCRAATTTGAVVLGRGAVALLRDDPRAFRVRLDGPVARRIEQAMRLEGIDEVTARQRQVATDQARALYVERAYGCDPSDPSLYHAVLDSTAIPPQTCAEAIAQMATGYWER